MKNLFKLDGSNIKTRFMMLNPDPNPYDPRNPEQVQDHINYDANPTYTIPAGFQEFPLPTVKRARQKWSGIIPWDGIEDGSLWIDGSVQSEIDQDFIDYCEDKKIEIDEKCAEKFEAHFLNPKHSERVKQYLNTVHTLKGEVANAHWNAIDKPAGDAERHPVAQTADSVTPANDYYFLLTRESVSRSLTMTQMVSAVKNLSDIQINAFDDLEEIRSPKKDLITVERDRETVPGTKDNNYTAVDQIVTDLQTALDAMSWPAV